MVAFLSKSAVKKRQLPSRLYTLLMSDIENLESSKLWFQIKLGARVACASIYNSANGKSEVVLSLTLLLREPLVFLVVSRTRTLSLIIILMKSQKGPLLYSALMYLHIQMSSQVFTFMWSKRMIYKSLYVLDKACSAKDLDQMIYLCNNSEI